MTEDTKTAANQTAVVVPVERQVRPQRWAIEFDDERDFCRFASLLIGAAYVDGAGALTRFRDGSLWGERTHGKVRASAARSKSYCTG